MQSWNKYGFSLLEMMVTMAIIGIIASIAVPSYLSYRPKHQLNRAVNEYHGMLQKARVMAIKDRTNCSITLNATSYSLACADSGYSHTVNLADYGGGVVFLQSNGFAFAGNSTDIITFNSRGTANPLNVYASHTSRSDIFYKIGPMLSGAIRTESASSPW